MLFREGNDNGFDKNGDEFFLYCVYRNFLVCIYIMML